MTIPIPSGARVWLAAGHTDMRKGFNGLAVVPLAAAALRCCIGCAGVLAGGGGAGCGSATGHRDRVCDRRADAADGADRWLDGQAGGRGAGEGQVAMIPVPSGIRVWLATGHTDMRKGFDGLAVLVQETLARNPHNGHLFVFRGRRGGLIKVLWHDGQGLCLFAKRLERGRFVWPRSGNGAVTITPAQLGYLLEGIDWRLPQHTWRPTAAG